MTLKEMLNEALLELGFTPYTEYFGSTKVEVRQLTALANREINKLNTDDWTELRKQHEIVMTSSNFYPLPSDWHSFVPDTAWTSMRRVDFPAGSEGWVYREASNVSTGLHKRMRLTDGQFEVQDPDGGDSILIEYISNSPVLSATGDPKQKFTADDDTLVLNDDLFVMGVLWRYAKAKGLDWQPNYAEYRRMYKNERGVDGGSQTVDTAGCGDFPVVPPQANYWQ